MIETEETLVGHIDVSTVDIQPELQDIEVIPSEEVQTILPEENLDGFSQVVVQPIPDTYVVPTIENETLILSRGEVVEEGLIV